MRIFGEEFEETDALSMAPPRDGGEGVDIEVERMERMKVHVDPVEEAGGCVRRILRIFLVEVGVTLTSQGPRVEPPAGLQAQQEGHARWVILSPAAHQASYPTRAHITGPGGASTMGQARKSAPTLPRGGARLTADHTQCSAGTRTRPSRTSSPRELLRAGRSRLRRA
jgi:hypothetical protein